MKQLKVLVIILCILVTKGFTQNNNSKVEVRLSYLNSTLGSVHNQEMINSSARQTSSISGYDLKMMLPTKRENFRWLIGSFYQDGDLGDSGALIGAVYIGPQISTKFRYVNFETYISAGIFGVSDKVAQRNQNSVVYGSVSNYTAPGTKSGLGISLSLWRLCLTGGYQIFIAAGNNHAVAYHGAEIGVGVKF